MALKPMIWVGFAYTIHIRRYWNSFFMLAPMCEIHGPRLTTVMPVGTGDHINDLHEMVIDAKMYFDTFDRWYSFERKLCDQYCDYYVMKNYPQDNIFNDYGQRDHNGKYAAQEFAKQSAGYIGPQFW